MFVLGLNSGYTIKMALFKYVKCKKNYPISFPMISLPKSAYVPAKIICNKAKLTTKKKSYMKCFESTFTLLLLSYTNLKQLS